MSDYEHLKLTAARQVIRLERRGSTPSRHKTWRLWWDKKFNDSFDRYTARKRREKQVSYKISAHDGRPVS